MTTVECGKIRCDHNKNGICSKERIRIGNPSSKCMDLDEPPKPLCVGKSVCGACDTTCPSY
ncbi:hypothetical protein SAMN02745123_03590 [Desulforamulus aeronauticus DSM 10349]|uniref:DUF1540 domain-containing protein n=1 Tax=Desulforamulus aeronauticus DSM 10349 TaxID=1121421 RepID=A0A1M6WEL3_9FIRM|nr:hypothetical protein SAMN02745123_03590 [Desulforamulus aeronauticus DSM 10349]